MKNLRDYESLIRNKIKEIDKADENWKWSIHSFSKNRVRISWGYLKYMGCKNEYFTMELGYHDEEFHDQNLVARTPEREIIELCMIGEDSSNLKSWQSSFEHGIISLLEEIAYYAHSRY